MSPHQTKVRPRATRPRTDNVGLLVDLAEDQSGLFTARQAVHKGVAHTTLASLVRRGLAESVARGVYRFRGTPAAPDTGLRAAWLLLDPGIPAWERTPGAGVVSHRSAAALLGLGDLPADVHEFTLPSRKQSSRPDVRLHKAAAASLADAVIKVHGLPVTRPARIAIDLLADGEEPDAVGRVIADALTAGKETPRAVAKAISGCAPRFGLAAGDGVGLLEQLLRESSAQSKAEWLRQAAA